jgi:hypothetical protein
MTSTGQIVPIERELRPLAHADERVRLLMTIPGGASGILCIA